MAKRTSNDLQNTTHNSIDRATRIPLLTGSELTQVLRNGRQFFNLQQYTNTLYHNILHKQLDIEVFLIAISGSIPLLVNY